MASSSAGCIQLTDSGDQVITMATLRTRHEICPTLRGCHHCWMPLCRKPFVNAVVLATALQLVTSHHHSEGNVSYFSEERTAPNLCDNYILDSAAKCLCGSFTRRAAECCCRVILAMFHFCNSPLVLPISHPCT